MWQLHLRDFWFYQNIKQFCFRPFFFASSTTLIFCQHQLSSLVKDFVLALGLDLEWHDYLFYLKCFYCSSVVLSKLKERVCTAWRSVSPPPSALFGMWAEKFNLTNLKASRFSVLLHTVHNLSQILDWICFVSPSTAFLLPLLHERQLNISMFFVVVLCKNLILLLYCVILTVDSSHNILIKTHWMLCMEHDKMWKKRQVEFFDKTLKMTDKKCLTKLETMC